MSTWFIVESLSLRELEVFLGFCTEFGSALECRLSPGPTHPRTHTLSVTLLHRVSNDDIFSLQTNFCAELEHFCCSLSD